MPTYKHNLVHFTRQSGKVLTMFMDKVEDKRDLSKGEDIRIRNNGIKLGIVERVDLLELKQIIECILEDCRDDGR